MRIAENINSFKEDPGSYDCINIVVDGSPSSDLSFKDLKEQVEQVLSFDRKVCLELFLDLHTEIFSFFNELEFAVRKRSLEVLLEKIEELVPEDKIHHIILYRGSTDFSNYIKRHAQTTEEYIMWKEGLLENSMEEEHLLHLFSCTLLSNFFHSLGAILPDHIKGALLFYLPAGLEIGKVAELVSEETFAHLEIGIRHPKFFHDGIALDSGPALHTLSYKPTLAFTEDKVKTAIILPFLGQCNYKRFEEICTCLLEKDIPFKIIEENLMNEKWFDIDHILFDNESTSFDGKRMLDGFIAAGGKAYSFTSEEEERENVCSADGFMKLENFFQLPSLS